MFLFWKLYLHVKFVFWGSANEFLEVTHAERVLPRAVASEPCASIWAAESGSARLGIVPEDWKMPLGVDSLCKFAFET